MSLPTHHRHKILACSTTELLNKDHISELPDDILLYIFKSLRMKDAGMTSVLSKRWRYVWAYKRRLHFSSRNLFEEFERGTKSPAVEGPKYLRWVDQVVRSYKAPIVNTFWVRFNLSLLGESCSNSIDNWFRFAMEKKVKKLTVDLLDYTQDSEYAFPSLTLCNTLTYLSLCSINVTGEILESFLCNCPTLISLSVSKSNSLECLRVSGPSLNLKCLTIEFCDGLKQLEISAPKLMYFEYCGPKINVHFKSTPKLAKLLFGGAYASDLISICSDISRYLSRIKWFSLSSYRPIKHCNLSIEGFIFTRLEKLELLADLRWNEDLYCYIPLIKACPLLHHFKLEFLTESLDYSKKRGLRKQEACPLNRLKIVEILGFVGHSIDLEFAIYLMECAVSLDKIIVDTAGLSSSKPESILEEVTEQRKEAMQRAELLRANCKPRTKLEIR